MVIPEVGTLVIHEGREWVVAAVTPTAVLLRDRCGRLLRVEVWLDTCQVDGLSLAA